MKFEYSMIFGLILTSLFNITTSNMLVASTYICIKCGDILNSVQCNATPSGIFTATANCVWNSGTGLCTNPTAMSTKVTPAPA